MDYIHANPVKHGWVTKPVNWPYSTFHRYVRLGLLPVDWMAGDFPASLVSGEFM